MSELTKQKAFKLKEDIRLYTGEDMQTEVLTIKARQVFDVAATYDVYDPVDGQTVGTLKRKGFKSMFRDEWVVSDDQEREIGLIQEDSTLLALLRCLVTNLIPQNYHTTINEKTVCTFNQNFNPFVTKVTADFSQDTEGAFDRRLGIAAALLLCAIEGKQHVFADSILLREVTVSDMTQPSPKPARGCRPAEQEINSGKTK
jgi:hypothetical protein